MYSQHEGEGVDLDSVTGRSSRFDLDISDIWGLDKDFRYGLELGGGMKMSGESLLSREGNKENSGRGVNFWSGYSQGASSVWGKNEDLKPNPWQSVSSTPPSPLLEGYRTRTCSRESVEPSSSFGSGDLLEMVANRRGSMELSASSSPELQFFSKRIIIGQKGSAAVNKCLQALMDLQKERHEFEIASKLRMKPRLYAAVESESFTKIDLDFLLESNAFQYQALKDLMQEVKKRKLGREQLLLNEAWQATMKEGCDEITDDAAILDSFAKITPLAAPFSEAVKAWMENCAYLKMLMNRWGQNVGDLVDLPKNHGDALMAQLGILYRHIEEVRHNFLNAFSQAMYEQVIQQQPRKRPQLPKNNYWSTVLPTLPVRKEDAVILPPMRFPPSRKQKNPPRYLPTNQMR